VAAIEGFSIDEMVTPEFWRAHQWMCGWASQGRPNNSDLAGGCLGSGIEKSFKTAE
jgi:hypothetical protein